jgi:hypothetical protein
LDEEAPYFGFISLPSHIQILEEDVSFFSLISLLDDKTDSIPKLLRQAVGLSRFGATYYFCDKPHKRKPPGGG